MVGAGFSSPEVNIGWADAQGFQYELWTDADETLATHYDALMKNEKWPNRHAYLLDETGQAIIFYEGAVSVGADPHRVLADAEDLFGP